ncbi:hypothetical protein MO867_21190 [Microbulbifer sp. OS29]|uniref:Uncharacterized protein n=1 Tax=Microbulbifer okhotskensis TaxID=2926617 RepID=A0A9X2ER36_9GAMM|nr:hypothetical protein [Microbulbifer okhotskensis]MCO1336847.1 hypothetical protein [Microbulbifer okhotskensis]
MKLSIINGDAGDDTTIINGLGFQFDLAGLIDDEVWAVQWSDEGEKASGEIELRDGTHKKIRSIAQFKKIIDRWHEEKAKIDAEESERQKLLQSRQFALDLIDNTAGKTRLRSVPIGYGMTDEYARVRAEAQKFVEAGFSGEIPAVIQTHAEVEEVSPQDAAEAILSAAIKWDRAIDKIRDIRIRAKAKIKQAEEGAHYVDIARPFVEQLKALEF